MGRLLIALQKEYKAEDKNQKFESFSVSVCAHGEAVKSQGSFTTHFKGFSHNSFG